MKNGFILLSKLLIILFAGLVFSGRAHALSCTTTSGLPDAIQLPTTIQVATSLPTGAVIPGTVRPFTIVGSCTGSIDIGHSIVACVYNGATEVMPGVYTTGAPGVGMSVLDSSGNSLKGAGGSLCNNPIGQILAGQTFNFSGTFELIRTTGAITSGAQFTPSAGQWEFGVYSTGALLNGSLANTAMYPSGTVTLKSITCNVTYPNAVAMPTVSVLSMPSIGSSEAATAFSIGLNCSNNAVVGLTMDAAPGFTVQSASTGVLNTQSGSGMASGYGVQLLGANSQPMTLQSRMSMGSIVANANNAYQFYAQYTRIAGTTSVGKVSSAMVFTFDYQ